MCVFVFMCNNNIGIIIFLLIEVKTPSEKCQLFEAIKQTIGEQQSVELSLCLYVWAKG